MFITPKYFLPRNPSHHLLCVRQTSLQVLFWPFLFQTSCKHCSMRLFSVCIALPTSQLNCGEQAEETLPSPSLSISLGQAYTSVWPVDTPLPEPLASASSQSSIQDPDFAHLPFQFKYSVVFITLPSNELIFSHSPSFNSIAFSLCSRIPGQSVRLHQEYFGLNLPRFYPKLSLTLYFFMF